MKGVLFGCLILWIINIAINVPLFVEHVYIPPTVNNSTLTSSTIALFLAGFLLTAIPSLLLSVVLPIITLRHLKTQVVLGDVSADVKKSKKMELHKAGWGVYETNHAMPFSSAWTLAQTSTAIED